MLGGGAAPSEHGQAVAQRKKMRTTLTPRLVVGSKPKRTTCLPEGFGRSEVEAKAEAKAEAETEAEAVAKVDMSIGFGVFSVCDIKITKPGVGQK